MRNLAFLLALPLLAGCNVHSKNPDDSDKAVNIQADENGQVSFDLPIIKGSVKLPSSMVHHGDVDIDGVKLMPGSKITGFSVMARDEGANVVLAFSAPASPDDVRSYYVGRFKEEGVDASVEGDSISGTTKDGAKFAIDVAPSAGGSTGKITIQDKG